MQRWPRDCDEVADAGSLVTFLSSMEAKIASLMDISQLLALGVKQGNEIVVIADGEDEAGAIREVISVIQYTSR